MQKNAMSYTEKILEITSYTTALVWPPTFYFYFPSKKDEQDMKDTARAARMFSNGLLYIDVRDSVSQVT